MRRMLVVAVVCLVLLYESVDIVFATDAKQRELFKTLIPFSPGAT